VKLAVQIRAKLRIPRQDGGGDEDERNEDQAAKSHRFSGNSLKPIKHRPGRMKIS
jgi:hypothetical protein